MLYLFMMRMAFIFLVLATPAAGWEFTTDPVCTISHATPQAEMAVTYDPGQTLPYSIAVRLLNGTWPEGSPYQVRFDGPKRFTISTNRHRLSKDKTTVIASDTGFGNVLDGLEFNLIAAAILEGTAVPVPLVGAPLAVQKFRDCTVAGLS